jgi:hypothetical protein
MHIHGNETIWIQLAGKLDVGRRYIVANVSNSSEEFDGAKPGMIFKQWWSDSPLIPLALATIGLDDRQPDVRYVNIMVGSKVLECLAF